MKAFRPGLLPSILLLALLPGLLGLGLWQLSRAEEKRQLLATHQARQHAAPIGLIELERQAEPGYRRVRLHGYFEPGHSLLLDNRLRGGKVGLELLQPFYDQPSGLWVLLNRGWLAWPDRRQAPQFTTPDTPLQLTAWVYISPGEAFQLAGGSTDKRWPRLITEVQVAGLWQELGRGGLPYELRLEPGPASLRLDWPVVAMSPDKHLGYAVQWFAMALALLILFIYFGLHNARETRHEPSHHPL